MSTKSAVFPHTRTRSESDTNHRQPTDDEAILEQLRALLTDLRFGSITLIVQDSRVVQIDTTHKLRVTMAAR
jgi:hypothetical protein